MADAKETHHFSRTAEELIGDLRGVPFHEPERMKKRPTKPVLGLIEDILNQFQIGRQSPEQTIRDNWVQVVGAANATYSHAVMIDSRGKLAVMASHSVVRNELFHHRKTIVQRIQALPACGHVRDIHIRAG